MRSQQQWVWGAIAYIESQAISPYRSISLVIPDDILHASQMQADELKLEIAMMLYQQQKISSGKVRAWTGLTVLEFQHELAKRDLYINYDIEDLQADVATLQSMNLL